MHRGTLFDEMGGAVDINISLYRPETKNGDPRIWPYELKKNLHKQTMCLQSSFMKGASKYLQNLTIDPIVDLDGGISDLDNFLSSLKVDYDRIANELLAKLRDLAANGPLEAVCEGDTAIGRTITGINWYY